MCSVAKNMKRKISFYMLLLSLSSLFLVEVACFQAIWASFATVLVRYLEFYLFAFYFSLGFSLFYGGFRIYEIIFERFR